MSEGSSLLSRSARLLHRVLAKAIRDDIFFLSGAIAFNLVMAVVPILVLAVGVAGYVLQAGFTDPPTQVAAFLDRVLPGDSIDPELVASAVEFVTRTVDARTGFSVVGVVLLILVSTRLAATLRSVLRVVFDVHVRRGLVRGKVFDVRLVAISGLVILANFSLVALLTGERFFGVLAGFSITVLSLWLLFAIIYRTAPPVRPRWRAVLVAASIATVGFEAMRQAFRWYFVNVASLSSTSGGIIALLVLLLFLYYASVVFVLAGEVGYLVTHPDKIMAHSESPLPEPPEPGSADVQPQTVALAGSERGTEAVEGERAVERAEEQAVERAVEPDSESPKEGAEDESEGILVDPRGV